ncbi:MAG: hypothetical protein IIX13_08895 [Bacteroidales bacterium]|nr:hypothetical protein [Bacteroidales bacterium]
MKKLSLFTLGLLALLLSSTSCDNFIENTKNLYSYQTLATLVPSNEKMGECFIADGGITLIASDFVKPDSIPYNSRFLLAFSVWDYNMNHEDSTWIVDLSAFRIIPKHDLYLLSDSTPDLATNQQLSNLEYCSYYNDMLTISCYTFKSKDKMDRLALTYDPNSDSIDAKGKHYVNLELKHYTPSINVHSSQWQLNSFDLSPLKKSYADKTDTLYINFIYTVETADTLQMKYAMH